jgi:tetratricopeptide (TPR) repeat protein
MTQLMHPLAMLRGLTGDTQLSYAELVAETHELLGFGKLHKRREKVSRWETQAIPPDHNTQLAIAHIHQVPEEEVLRLGWPLWLHLGTAATSRAARPRTRREAVGTVSAVRDRERPAIHLARSQLSLTGTALATFAREVAATVAGPPLPQASPSNRITPETATLIEERARTLYAMVDTLDPVALFRVARAEHGLATTLLSESSCDRATRTRLLLVTSKIAHLCGLISKGLGDDTRAERYYLAAVRAATKARSPLTVSVCLADLAWSHIDVGDPRDVLALVEAARAITPRPPARLAVVLYSREARAYAQLGQIIASARALDHTTGVLSADTGDDDPELYGNVSDEWLCVAAARAWLDAGQPKRALEYFAPLLDSGPGAAASRQPPLLVARDLLAVVDAQLALRDVESAVHSARRAVDLFDRMPSGLMNQYRRKFVSRADAPAVQDLIGLLAESSAA